MDDNAEEMVSPRSRSPALAKTRSNAPHPPDSKGFSTLYVCCCVSFYFVVSLSLTFLNKTVLRTFECPLFMTWLQFLVAFACLKCLGFLGLFSSFISKDIGIHDYSFSIQTLMKTLPLGLSYVAMVGVTNLTLFKVNLLLFQFVRALVIPFSIAVSFSTTGLLPSLKAGIACSFVVVGFLIGTFSDTDNSSSWIGIVFGVLSSLICAVYAVQVKRALQVLGDDTFKTLYYNSIWGLILLLPFIFYSERGVLLSQVEELRKSNFKLAFFFFTAVMGFMISISYVLNIRCSSPLTSHIVGSSKSALQSILALVIPAFKPSNPSGELNLLNIFGLFVVMAASLSYSYVQFQAGQAQRSSNTAKSK